MGWLNHVFALKLHVVAQVVKAEFVIGAKSNVGTISRPAIIVGHVMLDVPDS